ncbi:uncharacterized protein LOC117325801 [Pecten maximus]|uniref:uncharacterized protein LOC117325801 n=1 Tax=Pecten maximus TaxID=6579 RepID=UPI00145905EC|nr:uncharacterized protein LOC117325801 [Pecten maximus]
MAQMNGEMIQILQQNIKITKKKNVLKNCKTVSADIDNRKMELSEMLESWSQTQQSLVATQKEKRLENLEKYLDESETCLAIVEQFQRNPSSKNIDGKKLAHVLEMLQSATGASTRNVSEVIHEGNAMTLSTEMGDTDRMEKWFGRVTGIDSEASQHQTTKFKFCDSQISQISPISAKKAFVVTEGHLYLVDSTQVKCTRADIEPLMIKVKYITPVTERGIYVQQTDSDVIKRVTVNGQENRFADFKSVQFHPSQSLRIAHTGMVLSVIRFDDHFGKKVMLFHEYNSYGVRLKTSQNICCQYKDEFAHSVHTAGAIYALKTSNELPKNPYQPGFVVNVETATKYVGTIGSEPASTFHPRGLCKDQDDRLIVSDFWNHAIHQLTYEGKFQKFLMTEDDGLMNPTAVGIDNINWLWIAQKDGQIHIVKYDP